MARPVKTSVDYFPHMTHSGKTIAILEARWGNDGYAFWFKLLELLGDSSDFAFHCSRSADWEYLLSKTRVTEPVACAILDKLAEVEAIDADCWAQKIVWSDNFFRNLEPVFEKRKGQKPQKPEFPQPKLAAAEVCADYRSGNSAEPVIIPTETDKVKESKPTQSTSTQTTPEQSEGEQRETKQHESTNPEQPEKACAAAPARECASVSATEQTKDPHDNPVAEAGPAVQEQQSAPVLPEPPTAQTTERLAAPPASKRSGRKPAQQPCPSSLRPGVVQQADTVYLTGSELARLQREFGDPGAQRLIIILDGYKTNSPDKGAQYVDDYKAIRSWVVPRYRKEQSELQPGRRASPGAPYLPNTFNDKLADLALEEKL